MPVPLSLPKSSGFFLSLVLCGLHRTCPPPPTLPRASFPVPLSLPAAASLDFVSDFPRKGLCGGHGVKNTTFLMHSLGKPDPEAAPSLRAGLTCCLSYLPQPATPFLFHFEKIPAVPCHCFCMFWLMEFNSCMLNISVTFQTKQQPQNF